MPLSDYKPKRAEIKIDGDTSFEVRGLSVNDVSLIFQTHQDTVQEVYIKLAARAGLEMSEAVMVDTIRGIVEATPSLVATMIALAADEWDFAGIATTLPLPVQVAALQKIGELTFTDLAGAKKFIAGIAALLRNMIPATEDEPAKRKGKTA